MPTVIVVVELKVFEIPQGTKEEVIKWASDQIVRDLMKNPDSPHVLDVMRPYDAD